MVEQKSEPEDELEPIRWWRPDWSGALLSVGYRWITGLVVLAAVTVIAVAALFVPMDIAIKLLLLKLLVLLGGATISLAIYIVKLGVSRRRDPFCIFCGYSLSGLPDHYRCPECGRDYTFAMINEYREDPAWFIRRWNLRHQHPPPDATLDVPADAPRRPSRDGT